LKGESPRGDTEVSVAATGTAWVGSGVGSVNTAIEQLLEKTENEIQIVVYDVTGGADEFLRLLRTLLARGVQCTMVVNRFTEKPAEIQEGLRKMSVRFPQFQLFSFDPPSELEDLHAKIIIRDRREALVGSANLTWKGLVHNHELAVVVSGPPASTLAGLIDSLIRDQRAGRVA
jgi:phosphatidylserine/phosphatidylglycerophosphate/cardiolipin synthase-like enzyme